MIEWVSSWAEQIVLAIIIVSILELILPNNKNKKYVKMVLGIYVLFSILSPIFKDTQTISVEGFVDEQLENVNMQTNTNIDQSSMDKRLQELYIDALEKDIQSKVEEQGYSVFSCNVSAILDEENLNKGIQKIQMVVGRQKQEKEQSKIKNVNTIDIQVGINKYVKEKENEKIDNSKEIKKIVEMLSKTYEVNQNQISITME